ncbi:MAG: cupin domain-containing protein [Anaerolineae bacterium]|nr:cupin domain-containing protein [Anaerolineae bacterium]
MANKTPSVIVTRWQGGTHPSESVITRLLHKENLRPYMWDAKPNQRQAVHSHNTQTVLYVVSGLLEIHLPDDNLQVQLRSGDRIDIPANIRHSTIVGKNGARCAEANVALVRAKI